MKPHNEHLLLNLLVRGCSSQNVTGLFQHSAAPAHSGYTDGGEVTASAAVTEANNFDPPWCLIAIYTEQRGTTGLSQSEHFYVWLCELTKVKSLWLLESFGVFLTSLNAVCFEAVKEVLNMWHWETSISEAGRLFHFLPIFKTKWVNT